MFSLASFCLSSWHQNSWSGKNLLGKSHRLLCQCTKVPHPPPPAPVAADSFFASDDAFTASNWGQTFPSRLPRSSAYAGNNLHGFTLWTEELLFSDKYVDPGRETKKLPACHLDCPLKQASCEEADYCMVVKNAPVCLLALAGTLVWVTQEAKQSSGRGPVKVPLMGGSGAAV